MWALNPRRRRLCCIPRRLHPPPAAAPAPLLYSSSLLSLSSLSTLSSLLVFLFASYYIISTLVLILQVLTCFSWYYVKVHTTQKCIIFLSSKIHVLEIQWMLLSLDIVVERFLEISASDLLVSTQWLQDPSYEEVWETYSSLKYCTRKAKYHDLADNWHFTVNCITHWDYQLVILIS